MIGRMCRGQSSPRTERKNKLTRTQTGMSQGRTAAYGDNVTVFKLPGVNMSVSYKSRMELVTSAEASSSVPSGQPRENADHMTATSPLPHRGVPVKRANIYTWIELEKLSQVEKLSYGLFKKCSFLFLF